MPAPQKLNFLAAFPYLKPRMLDRLVEHKDHLRFLVDSGAFTAWKQGRVITLDDYCRFLESLPFDPWRYFTLDVIGDPHATRANYETMRQRGFKPIPIYTRGEDPRALDDYFDTSDLVGLGGLAGTSQRPAPYLKWLWPQLKGRPVHVLGFSTINWLKHLRPYSCDSSNWLYGTRMGRATVYVGRGQMKWVQKKHFMQNPNPLLLERIRALGFNPALLQRQEGWHGGDSLAHWICAASWVRAQTDIAKNLGTLYFLACAAADTVEVVGSCYLWQTTGHWSKVPPGLNA